MTIDIITITYNNYDGLKKTSENLLKQTYHHINWIIIDGLSSDNSMEYLNSLNIPTNINLKIISEQDKGIYDAMNKGIDNSAGDYLIFLNAGDQLENENTLNNIFLHLNINDFPAIIYGNFYRELKDNTLALVMAKPLWYIYHSLPTSHQAIFYNRNSVDTLRYNLKYKISSDYDFTAKFIKNNQCITTKNYLKIDEIISVFEYNGLSKHNMPMVYKDAYDIQNEVFNLNIGLRTLSYLLKYLRNKLL